MKRNSDAFFYAEHFISDQYQYVYFWVQLAQVVYTGLSLSKQSCFENNGGSTEASSTRICCFRDLQRLDMSDSVTYRHILIYMLIIPMAWELFAHFFPVFLVWFCGYETICCLSCNIYNIYIHIYIQYNIYIYTLFMQCIHEILTRSELEMSYVYLDFI